MAYAQSDKLTVYIFNVDRGDHVLVELPNGEFGIIDFYYHPNFGFYPEETVLGEIPALLFLKNLKAEGKRDVKIAFLHISHPDYDHAKGIGDLCKWIKQEEIPVRNLWWFGGMETVPYLEGIRRAIEKEAKENPSKENDKALSRLFKRLAEIRELEEVAEHSVGLRDIKPVNGALMEGHNSTPNIRVFNMAPPEAVINDISRSLLEQETTEFVRVYAKNFFNQINELDTKRAKIDKNQFSSALLLEYPPFKLMFGGDVHKKTWKLSFKEYEIRSLKGIIPSFDAHWHKVSHHGSHNSSARGVWRKLIALDTEIGSCHFGISAGHHLGYRHPRLKTISDIYYVCTNRSEETDNHIDWEICSTNHCGSCYFDRMPNDEIRLDPWMKYSPSEISSNFEREGRSARKSSGYEADEHKSQYLVECQRAREETGFEIESDPKTNRMLAALVYEFYPKEKRIQLKFGTTARMVDNRPGNGRCCCILKR